MHIIILETDLFPDREAMERALTALEAVPMSHRLSRYDLRRADMTNADWDSVLGAVLTGDTIVTV